MRIACEESSRSLSGIHFLSNEKENLDIQGFLQTDVNF